MSVQFWERAAGIDPMWAVLSDPTKRGRRWSAAEFFATGRRDISLLLFQLSRLGHAPRLEAALDFGCGLGRLTQALAARFERVVGVDVAPNMIRLATLLNQCPSRASYVLNQRPDLTCLDGASFDLVFSDIVLQHIPPADSRAYIAEFVRVLRPGGIAVFQLPSMLRPPLERMAPPAAMPDDAYRAAITPAPGALTHLEPGVMRDCAIAVRNLSFTDWDRRVSGLIRLGNHWLGPDGTMLIQDDGRSALPQCVAGGTEATLVVPVTAPREPGHYLCEFDLVHEHVCWFGDRGSRTARVQVIVGDGAGPRNDGTGDAASAPAVYPEIDEVLPPLDPGVELGEFPMYGVAKDEVLEILRALGTDCVHIEPDERGGPEWVGYRYFVRRNA